MTASLVVLAALMASGLGWWARARRPSRGDERLEGLLEAALDAILTVDGDRRVVSSNPAAQAMFERSASELRGVSLDLLVRSSEDAAETLETSEMPADVASLSSWIGVRKSGATFPAEASKARAAPSGLSIVIVRDVTERVAQASEIARLNRLYAALGDLSHATVESPDRETLFRRVCEALVARGGCRMAWVGWRDDDSHVIVPITTAGDVHGYAASIRVTFDDTPEGRGPTGTALRQNRPYVCNDLLEDPHMLPWRDAIVRSGFAASAALPIHFEGAVRGVLSVYASERGFFQHREVALLGEAARDLSFALENLARKRSHARAEAAAARERSFARSLIASLPGILYLYDEAGHFLRWNTQFEEVTGYTAAEIEALHPLALFRGDDVPALVARIAEVFAHGEGSIEANLVDKSGRATPYYFTGRRIEFEGKTCLVGVGVDIAARKEAQEALRRANEGLERTVRERTFALEVAKERAEAADRIKSAFLATMSHELRTPLNSILGFTGILVQGLAGPTNPEQTKQLGMVQASARHLLDLINDVLDISKIEAGQLEIHAAPFDLAAAVRKAVDSIGPLASKKGLTLSLEIGEGAFVFHSDVRRLSQVLLNLLQNAVKFTDRGSIEVLVDRLEGGAARIRVKDTGIGISESGRAQLFQPFRQLDTGLQRMHEGTGLGLAISARLVALLGGTIGVESAVGRGSTFTVTVPSGPSKGARAGSDAK